MSASVARSTRKSLLSHAAIWAVALMALLSPMSRAAAGDQAVPRLHNENISIRYLAPRSDKYQTIYERLKARQILEELDAFLSPVNLGTNHLTLSVEEGDDSCKGPNSYYQSEDQTLHLCYSWFYFLENEVSREYPRAAGEPFTEKSLGRIPGFTRAEVIVGASVGVTLHELGHAASHLLKLPRFGREEDLADQFASFFMLQFGPSVALTTIKGTYNGWHHFNALRLSKGFKISPEAEAEVHSLDIQRAYNFLCTAYGKYPDAFQDLADALLPRARRSNCKNEYAQAALAFDATILPKLDKERMAQVLKMPIFRAEDFKF